MKVEGRLESFNELVEKRSGPVWLGLGLVGASFFAGSTFYWVGLGDLVAGGAAVLSGAAGLGAAIARRRLDHLPMELAPIVVRSEDSVGEEITVRGWLGRGRRVERLRIVIEAEREGERQPVECWVPEGPIVGRFQVVFPAVEKATFHVRVSGVSRGVDVSCSRTYAPADVRVGRFAPGLVKSASGLVFRVGEWSSVEGGPPTM